MKSNRTQRGTFLSALLGLTLALAMPAISQEPPRPSNQDVQSARQELIERYEANQDPSERDRIVRELTRLRHGEEEKGPSKSRAPGDPQLSSRARSNPRNRRPFSPPRSMPPLPFPSTRTQQSNHPPRSARPRSSGLGAQANAASESTPDRNRPPTNNDDRTPHGIQVSDDDRSIWRRVTKANEISRKFLDEITDGTRFGTAGRSATNGWRFDPSKGEFGWRTGANAEAAVVGSGGQWRAGNDDLEAKIDADGSVGKTNANVDAQIGIGKKFVGAQANAGASASLLSGNANLGIGSRWFGLTLEAELTGELIAAGGNGKAGIGWNRETESFEIELGAKIGALLFGAGAKGKISLNKPGWWPSFSAPGRYRRYRPPTKTFDRTPWGFKPPGAG